MTEPKRTALSSEAFLNLNPYTRGYAVYMFGNRDDQPNIPSESNPYPEGTSAWREWNRGNFAGVLEAQDSEE